MRRSQVCDNRRCQPYRKEEEALATAKFLEYQGVESIVNKVDFAIELDAAVCGQSSKTLRYWVKAADSEKSFREQPA